MRKNVLITAASILVSLIVSVMIVNGDDSEPIEPDPVQAYAPQAGLIEQLTPTDGRIYESGSVTFEWRADATSQWYWIWIESYGNTILVEWYETAQVCEGMTCTVNQAMQDGDYNWYIGGWDEVNGFGPFNQDGEAFFVGPVIQALTPTENGTLTNTKKWGTFIWNHNPSMNWYGIYVGQEGAAGKLEWFPAAEICTSSQCTADMHLAILNNGAYQFWVAGYNPTTNAIGPWGAARNFNVQIDSPGIPQNIKHIVNESTPTLTWENDPNAGYYQVYIGTSDFKTTWYLQWLKNDSTLCPSSQCSLTPDYAFFDGDYVAYIQAWSPGGFNLGDANQWSQPYNFNMDTGNTPTLRFLASARGLYMGAALNTTRFVNNDPNHNEILAREFNMLTPENAMKWDSIHPAQNEFDFTVPDQIMNFAESNNMDVRGHVLVWYNQNPAWLTDGFSNGTYTAEQMKKFMEDHIKKVVQRYGNRIQSWDVVNEAFAENNSIRTDFVWYQVYGSDDYIAKAFQFAREANSSMLLYYNDYNIEGPGIRTDNVYNMLQGLKNSNIPIDGVGMQGHVKAEAPLTQQQIVDTMRRFNGLGLRVGITEMDVRVADVPGTLEEKYEVQAEVYAKFLRACLEVGPSVCDTFGVWGISDADSWIPDWFGVPDWPLLYDEDFNEKPAYDALIDVFLNG